MARPATLNLAVRAAQQAKFIKASVASLLTEDQLTTWPLVIAEGGAGWGRLLREFAFGSSARGRALHMFEYVRKSYRPKISVWF